MGTLRDIHAELDIAVAEAYGWPATISDQEILARMVALNEVRSKDELSGRVHWLRPEFQAPRSSTHDQIELGDFEIPESEVSLIKDRFRPRWPGKLADQASALRNVLGQRPASASVIARSLSRTRLRQVEALLETLVTLGQARRLDDGRFARL